MAKTKAGKQPGKPGRPTRADDETLLASFEAYIRQGLAPERAAAAAGLGERTWYSWREKAADGVEPYLSAVERMETARAQLEGELLAAQIASGKEDTRAWQALMTVLERTGPDNYSVKKRVEVEMKGQLERIYGVMEEALRKELPFEWYRRTIEIIARAFGVDTGSGDEPDSGQAPGRNDGGAPPTTH